MVGSSGSSGGSTSRRPERATEPESLVLQYLRRLGSTVQATREDLGDLKRRMPSVEEGLVGLSRRVLGVEEALVGVNRRLDRLDDRVERIERRLDFAEA